MSFLIPEEKDQFYRLYLGLLYWVNEKQKIVKDFAHSRHPKGVDVGKVFQIKDKMFDNPEWIDNYLCEHGIENTEEEQDIILSWRKYFIKERFYVMRHLKNYSVFMNEGNENTIRLYGVVGLTQPFSELIDKSYLPAIVQTTILPFKDQIVFDGLFEGYNIRLGSGIRGELNRLYSLAKTRYGIIGCLPFDDSKPRLIENATRNEPPSKSQRVDDKKLDIIAGLISEFCDDKLNKEFLDVSLHVLKKLSRKRPSPLISGKVSTWACGIVYAVASNNFVFDRSQPYYMSAQDIADEFCLSKSTAQSQAAKINKMLKINYFTPEYVIASIRDNEHGLINTMRRYGNVMSLFDK